MAKAKNTQPAPQEKSNTAAQKKNTSESAPVKPADNLRINLAIGTLTLALSILLLYILNKVILSAYTPGIKSILDRVIPLSIQTPDSFYPEPVERMQYQLSLLFTPIFIFLSFTMINKNRKIFTGNPSIALLTNVAGIISLLCYVALVFRQDLLYVTDETTAYFFSNNLISKYNILAVVILYTFFAYLFFLYARSRDSVLKKTITNVVSYGIVFFFLADLVMYNIFQLPVQEWGRLMETNAAFYSITQVYAGKSLLVDTNSQYGLYAWIIGPLFKIIGLSTYKFGLVMALLNAASFFLFYLGIKRILKQDLLAILVFLTFMWWQYWSKRIPFEATPHFYYQTWPVRIIFPSLTFYLIVVYQTCKPQLQKIILPLLTLSSAIAVLWNADTGVVVFGATTIALLYSTLNAPAVKDTIRRSIVYFLWMAGSLVLVIGVFMIATKMHTGTLPHFKRFADFQSIFYISGFFMLPMSAIHFWNFPAIVYLIACIYGVYQVRKEDRDATIVVFLFILGAGIFAYFQGRSYDLNISPVMYPAIIILGIFCKKLIPGQPFTIKKMKLHESYILFLIPFFFFIDSAFSMAFSEPSIHTFASDNASVKNEEKEKALAQRIDFLKSNLHPKDTVLILAKDYESYYYASGNYYNPVNLPGSTEIFFKSEIDTLLNFIETTKYPIVYDATHPWTVNDTIVKTLAEYTTIEKALPDQTMLLLKPGRHTLNQRLPKDAKTIYYNNSGDFSKYMSATAKLQLPDTFTVEFFATLDSGKLKKDNLIFSNIAQNKQFFGFLMVQYGNDLTQYLFTYGNGSVWCNGAVCKLNCNKENHVVIKVQKNIITAYNNDVLCAQSNTNSGIKNSDGAFFINPSFAGKIDEIKISRQ